MAYRPRGRARVDPESPDAFAICDRCGNLFNHRDLRWQYQWQGFNLFNKRLLVCEDCLDKPSPFLRAIVVSADPQPVFNARTEPYSIDEAGGYDPSAWRINIQGVAAFRATLEQFSTIIPAFNAHAISGVTLSRSIGGITGAYSATAGASGSLKHIKQVTVAATATAACAFSFTFGVGAHPVLTAIASFGASPKFSALLVPASAATGGVVAAPRFGGRQVASMAATGGAVATYAYAAHALANASASAGSAATPYLIRQQTAAAGATSAMAGVLLKTSGTAYTVTAVFGATGGMTGPATQTRLWTPVNYGATVVHWYDLQDTGTFTDVGGGIISVLNDKSGNSYNLTAVSGKRGTLTYANASFNNFNTLNFGTNGMGMTSATYWSGASAWLLDFNSSVNSLNLNGSFTTTPGFSYPINCVACARGTGTTPQTSDPIHRLNGTAFATATAGSAVPAASSYFFAGRLTSAGQSSVGRFCDVAGSAFGLGNRVSDYARTATGHNFAELIIVNGDISDADTEIFEGYLAWKYALEASLPSGHTYKNAAPIATI